MQAKSIKGKTVAEIKAAVETSMANGYKPTLAIVFIPKKNEALVVCDLFDEKGISVFGASSYGQFIDKDHDTDSIVVMLLDIKPEHFRIEFRETGNSTTKEIAASIAEAGKAAFSKPAFIVASGGIKTDGEKIIEGIEQVAGKDTALFGGLAACDFKTMVSFVFTNGNLSDNGLAAIILDDEKMKLTGSSIA